MTFIQIEIWSILEYFSDLESLHICGLFLSRFRTEVRLVWLLIMQSSTRVVGAVSFHTLSATALQALFILLVWLHQHTASESVAA